jgi:hypothetical protein
MHLGTSRGVAVGSLSLRLPTVMVSFSRLRIDRVWLSFEELVSSRYVLLVFGVYSLRGVEGMVAGLFAGLSC